jgi:hypothetical protein
MGFSSGVRPGDSERWILKTHNWIVSTTDVKSSPDVRSCVDPIGVIDKSVGAELSSRSQTRVCPDVRIWFVESPETFTFIEPDITYRIVNLPSRNLLVGKETSPAFLLAPLVSPLAWFVQNSCCELS